MSDRDRGPTFQKGYIMARYLNRKVTFKCTSEEFERLQSCLWTEGFRQTSTISKLVRKAVMQFVQAREDAKRENIAAMSEAPQYSNSSAGKKSDKSKASTVTSRRSKAP